MSKLRCHISVSADGFVAGPNQSEENPLGEGGERLHDWIVPLVAWREAHDKQGGEVNASARIVEESRANIGAGVMGRNMFGPVGGGTGGRGGGRVGGEPTRRITTTCSSSPITGANPWRWKEGARTTSSHTETGTRCVRRRQR